MIYLFGGLLGVWIVFEDMMLDNGFLYYYFGSYKLFYLFNDVYGNEGNCWKIGDQFYFVYEQMMGKKVKEWGLEKCIFEVQAGDVLIWYVNLLYGGEFYCDKSQFCKSMVLYYFKEGYICYYEVMQWLVLMKQGFFLDFMGLIIV